MAETFPLPRSGYKLLRLILIGYLHEGGRDRKGSGPTDVGRATGLDQTVVSRNNAPLAALGLLEQAESRKWRLTQGGEEVARAMEYEAEDELRSSLGGVLRNNEYVRRIVTFVRARGEVAEDQLVSHMALTAGVKRSAEFLTGARALLEFLLVAGILEYDGDTIRAAQPVSTAPEMPDRTTTTTPSPPSSRRRSVPVPPSVEFGNVLITFNVSAGDLKSDAAVDKLAARLRRLVEALLAD
jgi:hypothetical protein